MSRKSSRIGPTSGDKGGYRLYKGDRALARKVEAELRRALDDLPPPDDGPPLRRREVLYQRAYLSYLTDRHQRSVHRAWLEHMDGTLSPDAFCRRVEDDGWVKLRAELLAQVAAGMLEYLAQREGLELGELDHRLLYRQEEPAPDQPLPDICFKTRTVWRRVVGDMGPRLWVVPRSNARTRRAMDRWEVAEFIDGDRFTVGRLKPLGVHLRDRWHRADCWREWERRKAEGLTRRCGGRNKCRKLVVRK